MSNSCNYTKRGNRCTPQTCALTSNAKYILPHSSVYFKPWTKMINYPGRSSSCTTESRFVTEPEHIKAYNGKDIILSHHHDNTNILPKKCKTCN